MLAQQALHGRALHTLTSAVNQANDFKASGLCRSQVLIDDRHHIARSEGVQVYGVFDGHVNSVVFHRRA
jgi:hypothetical protein